MAINSAITLLFQILRFIDYPSYRLFWVSIFHGAQCLLFRLFCFFLKEQKIKCDSSLPLLFAQCKLPYCFLEGPLLQYCTSSSLLYFDAFLFSLSTFVRLYGWGNDTRKADLSTSTSRTNCLMYSRVVVDPCMCYQIIIIHDTSGTSQGPCGCRLVRVVRVV